MGVTNRSGHDDESVCRPDVTVRMPVYWNSPHEAAGFVQRAVTEALHRQGWGGEAVVIYRTTDDSLVMFHKGVGIADLGGAEMGDFLGGLPHGLSEPGPEPAAVEVPLGFDAQQFRAEHPGWPLPGGRPY